MKFSLSFLDQLHQHYVCFNMYISFQPFLYPFSYLSYLTMQFIYLSYFGFIWSLDVNSVCFTPRHFSLNITNQSSIFYLFIFLVEVKLEECTNLQHVIWWVLENKYTFVTIKIMNTTITLKKSFVSLQINLFLPTPARCNNCYDNFHHRLVHLLCIMFLRHSNVFSCIGSLFYFYCWPMFSFVLYMWKLKFREDK